MNHASNNRRLGYSIWRKAVDQRLLAVYAITIEMSGVDDDYLRPHWVDDISPSDFVAWFGAKYDLDPILPVHC